MGSKPALLRKVLAALVLIVGSFSTLVDISVKAQTTATTAGELSVTGSVTLNGLKAASGITVFSGSHIETARNGTATANISKLGRIQCGQNTEMTLLFSEGTAGGNLFSGRSTLSAPAGVSISIKTPDGVVTSDGKQATVLTVELSNGKLRVAAARGNASIASGDKVYQVAAGKEVSLSAQAGRPGDISVDVGGTASPASVGGGTGGGSGGSAIPGLIVAAAAGSAAGIAAKSSNAQGPLGSVSPIKP